MEKQCPKCGSQDVLTRKEDNSMNNVAKGGVAGAIAGSVIPGVGTILGAALGGIAGKVFGKEKKGVKYLCNDCGYEWKKESSYKKSEDNFDSIKERLRKLKELKDEGLLSEEEYNKKRENILDMLRN